MNQGSIGLIGSPKASSAHAPWQSHVRSWLLVTASFALLAVGQATAQDEEGAASAQAVVPEAGNAAQPDKQDKPGKSRKVCEYEDVTGSRMKKRVCFTPEQWDARHRAAKDLVRELDGKPIGKDAGGG